jgi:rubrerythrin
MTVGTMLSALEAVDLAIEMERSGHKFYLSAASRTADRNGGEMFSRLANDELAHLFWLINIRQSLLQTGQFGETNKEIVNGEGQTLPADLISIPSSDSRGEVTAETGELEALELGIQDEMDAVAFYRRVAEMTDDPAGRALFQRLTAWESEHQQLLEAEHDYLLSNGFYLGIAEFHLEGPAYLSWWRR